MKILGDNSRQDDRDSYGRVQSAGIRFEAGGFMPCEDDEDLCDIGSGSGPGSYDSREYDSQNNVFGNMKHHDSKLAFRNFRF